MPQAAGENGPPQGKIRVLVVDDSAFMRMTLSRYLNEMPDMTVVASARDGREALELIDQFEPDVVTLDVEMPQMDGLTTLRKIMASRPTPVIMLSSLTMEGARDHPGADLGRGRLRHQAANPGQHLRHPAAADR